MFYADLEAILRGRDGMPSTLAAFRSINVSYRLLRQRFIHIFHSLPAEALSMFPFLFETGLDLLLGNTSSNLAVAPRMLIMHRPEAGSISIGLPTQVG